MVRKRKYDRDFKIEAVRLAIEGNRKITEVVRNLGIHPNLIYNWKKQLADDSNHAFPGHGRLKPDEERLRKLQRELEDIKEERDILKKALAIFSNLFFKFFIHIIYSSYYLHYLINYYDYA